VVGGVFGKDKYQVYNKYPELASMTIPKQVLISPVGDEIINPKKFNKSLRDAKKSCNEMLKKRSNTTVEHDAISRSDLAEIAQDSREDEEDKDDRSYDRQTSTNHWAQLRLDTVSNIDLQHPDMLINGEDDFEVVKFRGGPQMKSIIKFNHESSLGLNASDVFQAFDISKQITSTVRAELK